jgi:aryl sulfotransferase
VSAERPGAIVWLASYPGSGNTWMRVFVSNLTGDADAPADINDLTVRKHAASRAWFDAHAGVAASDLTDEEIEELRPVVYEAAVSEQPGTRFVKIHDACLPTPAGRPLVSPAVTAGVIYILRNPLDVAAAYAHHRGASIDETIDVMGDEQHRLGGIPSGMSSQLTQRLGSWSTHVTSWVDAPHLRVHVARYEDMQHAPSETFAAVADFAGIAWTHDTLERAIAASEFAELQRQEDRAGFEEGSRRATRFFRRGQAGAWRDELVTTQIRRIVERHGPTMQRFGYLDENGAPT